MILVVVTTLIIACPSAFDIAIPKCPTEVSGQLTTRLIRHSDLQLTFNGAAFSGDKLYVGSSVGLLELESTTLSRAFKCSSTVPDGFDKVTFDRANDQLWTRNLKAGKSLLRFSNSEWYDVGLPPKSQGYTRGDISALRMFSTESGFWLQVTTDVWRWDQSTRAWNHQQLPPVECRSVLDNSESPTENCLASIAPIRDRTAFIMRSKFDSSIREGRPPNDLTNLLPDRVLFRHGDAWADLAAGRTYGLYTKEVIVGTHTFVRTFQDRIFRLTYTSIDEIESLGKIDTLATDKEGNLLAAFRGKGIFVYRGGWIKLFDYPFEAVEGYYVKVAVGDNRIAIIYNEPFDERSRANPSRIWISADQELREIRF